MQNLRLEKSRHPKPTLAEISCSQLQGVGPKIASYLAKCGLHSLQDLLLHLPLRYEDRTKLTTIKEARCGTRILISGIIHHDKTSAKNSKVFS